MGIKWLVLMAGWLPPIFSSVCKHGFYLADHINRGIENVLVNSNICLHILKEKELDFTVMIY